VTDGQRNKQTDRCSAAVAAAAAAAADDDNDNDDDNDEGDEMLCCRCFPMSARLLSPRASTSRLHPDDVLAQFPRRTAVVAVLLDRPGVGAGTNVAQHPDHPDHYHAEQRFAAQHASRLVHEGHRRLDGHLSRLRVWRVHRVLHRQHAGSQAEGEDQPRGDDHQRPAGSYGRRRCTDTADSHFQCCADARSQNSTGKTHKPEPITSVLFRVATTYN